MHALKKNIPNFITLGNLIFGLFAILFAFYSDLKIASFCIFFGAFLDFFDGLSARILNVHSELGKQLDSMADIITFGIAPGFIMFQLLGGSIYSMYSFEFFLNLIKKGEILDNIRILSPLVSFIIPVLSAYRLAKFNIDSNQKTNFIGLPTPITGILIASLPLINTEIFPFFLNQITLILIALVMSLLLISKIPFFSFKISKNENLLTRINIFRITLVATSILLLLIFSFSAIPLIIILYIILSVINNIL